MLAALVVVLQLFASAIPAGKANLAFALVPIVLGAVLFGPFAGAFLGAVMGLVVSITVITGATDPMSLAMFNYSPFATIFLCMIKSSVAGFLAGIVSKAILKATGKSMIAVFAASSICPIVNTGIFSIGFLTIFRSTVNNYAISEAGLAGATALLGLILLLNFLPELAINVILAPAIERVIYAIKKQH